MAYNLRGRFNSTCSTTGGSADAVQVQKRSGVCVHGSMCASRQGVCVIICQ